MIVESLMPEYEYLDPMYFIISGVLSLIIVYFSWFFRSHTVASLVGCNKAGFTKNSAILIGLGGLQLLGLILISIATAGPYKTKSNTIENKDIRDIYFVVDVSRSMLADDFLPNRLEVAKKYIKKFVDMRSNDRIGLNIFAEKIITLSPLTFDRNSVKDKVRDIEIGFLGNGTNIGDGLALAVGRLKNSAADTKIVILLTDGVSNAGSISPLHAGEISRDNNIKVYGIGIGTEGDAFIPYQVGRQTMRQRIPGGNIDHKTLENITKMTGGEYYKANNENALKNIFDKINNLEKTNFEIEKPILIKYFYKRFFAYGLFLFLLTEIIRRYLYRFSL